MEIVVFGKIQAFTSLFTSDFHDKIKYINTYIYTYINIFKINIYMCNYIITHLFICLID